jgi:hypothetical protein
MLYLQGEKVGFADLQKSANHKKDWVRKSKICKQSHLRKSLNITNLSPQLFPPLVLCVSDDEAVAE